MGTQIDSKPLVEYSAQFDNRQPTNINYLRPTGFKFLIQTLPKVTYFCQSANIPELGLGVAWQETPLVAIPHPGEKITFGELNVRFMIQEDMSNYIELYNWMIGLGFPEMREQFAKFVGEHAFTFPGVALGLSEAGQFSDATLVVLGSNNMPTAQIIFKDCFPVSLSGLEFSIEDASTHYFQASATFRYREFGIEVVGTSS